MCGLLGACPELPAQWPKSLESQIARSRLLQLSLCSGSHICCLCKKPTLSANVLHSELSSITCDSATNPHACSCSQSFKLTRVNCSKASFQEATGTWHIKSPAARSSTNSLSPQSLHFCSYLERCAMHSLRPSSKLKCVCLGAGETDAARTLSLAPGTSDNKGVTGKDVLQLRQCRFVWCV